MPSLASVDYSSGSGSGNNSTSGNDESSVCCSLFPWLASKFTMATPPTRKVLIAVDGSSNSEHAFDCEYNVFLLFFLVCVCVCVCVCVGVCVCVCVCVCFVANSVVFFVCAVVWGCVCRARVCVIIIVVVVDIDVFNFFSCLSLD